MYEVFFGETPGNVLQLLHISAEDIGIQRHTKPLGPQPDLTNHNCFTSRTAEGASRSDSHFEAHSSKHFPPLLAPYSWECGLLKKKQKIWGVGRGKLSKCNMTVLCRPTTHAITVTVAHSLAVHNMSGWSEESSYIFSLFCWCYLFHIFGWLRGEKSVQVSSRFFSLHTLNVESFIETGRSKIFPKHFLSTRRSRLLY